MAWESPQEAPSFAPEAPSGGLPPAPPYPAYRTADGVYALLCLVLGYMGVRWLFFGRYGYGTTLCFALFAAATAIYLKRTGAPLTRAFFGWMVLLLVFGLSFSLYGQPLVSGLCGLLLLLAGTLWIGQGSRGLPLLRSGLPADLLRALFVYPFAAFPCGGGAARSLLKRLPLGRKGRGVLLGLLLALPVTLLVGVLLLRADAAFSSFAFSLLPDKPMEAIGRFLLHIFHLALGLPAALALFSLAFSSRHDLRKGVLEPEAWNRVQDRLHIAPRSVLYAAMTPVCLLYVLFFFSQSAYVFSAFSNYLPAGFTYADYARRGFFELCAVAEINFALVLLMQLLCKRKEGTDRAPAGLRVYTVLLGVFTLLLIATALRKMLLYIGSYGLTPLRVYTSWFMILLGGVFLLLLVRQAAGRFPLVKAMAVWIAVLSALLCFSGVNGWIARYNVAQYQNGSLRQMDVDLLDRLGPEAVPAAARLLEDEEEDVARAARFYLRRMDTYLKSHPAIEGNLAFERAKQVLEREDVRRTLQDRLLADEAASGAFDLP